MNKLYDSDAGLFWPSVRDTTAPGASVYIRAAGPFKCRSSVT